MYRYQSESLTRRGPYPTRRTLELVARSHARALEHGEGSSGRVRPLLSSWLVEALRHAAIAQDRAALREIARAGQAPVPMRWRAVSLCARLLPGPCWRGALAAWERLRGVRVARR